MRRSPRTFLSTGGLLLGVFIGLGSMAPAPARAQGSPSLARLTLVEQQVEQKDAAAAWRQAVEGQPLRIGEQLRTGPAGLARLEMPWMSLTVSPGSAVSFPDEFILSAVLESGRAVVDSKARDALKVVTSEARVRGTGRAVVRREDARTLVSCLGGRFLVEGSGQGVWLESGYGTVVGSGAGPSAPRRTPEPPVAGSLLPGPDPVYAKRGETVELQWKGDAPAFQVEILPVGSEQVLIQRDVGSPPARIPIPWSGAFRWRVASRDARGLEGRPSSDGQIAVELRE